ncbi:MULTISPECIES: gamma-glutamyltransferase family protein [unclassified Gordonia (in: high G+C Gram-positive bacteria)]|uniref:gamma-glutamyltransferase family protein n=1 Tax=unclassified Gordonia (in: high G+C Gram-positive bacteria) TaxID=2657482 RepID=UPI0007E99E2C|nr:MULTISPECIES: gamma-glutamyltransferase family protein [unclassified Gordonia (in: high G+C Gram-positive bacteria)]OBB99370.1 gamma-glutamyltransferase [Gordonia sp. 852002-50395_SCH5434458]OBC04877.1 gamma-glutamyltransferase [Gordonia sp. 852002-50816_SCH5313054-a]OBC20574.1 gamma-glutamyltransferase [Gordonia sp. 852002-50816_SCH5313054-c]
MRRPPHPRPLLRAAALAIAPALILTACSSTNDDAAQPSVTCGEIPTGTQTDSSAAPKSSQDISTRPEAATGYRTGMQPVQTNTYAAATANPLATKAACETLRDGGTAADALVTAQMVLGLVEPQSSGIGGGSFALYYDAAKHKVTAFDGRETAPAAATEDYLRYISPIDQRAPIPSARASGRSIGVPGAVRMLEEIHKEHGRTAWKNLFDPAVSLSDNGFDISPRLATAISESAGDLKADDDARSYFLNPDGTPKTAGTRLANPAYAKTLGALATDGAQALYTGSVADAIVAKAGSTSNGMTPSLLTADDLKNYKAMRREPVSTEYRGHRIVAMPGPSSGGITVAATMGILSNFDIPSMGPTGVDRDGGHPNPEAVHLINEAERLAYADRDKYIADPDFIPLPGKGVATMLDPTYLKQRAALIKPNTSLGKAQPGDLGEVPLGSYTGTEHGTSHITVADKYGNVASMTTTVESAFGSFHMVDGFILNNQLTDFSAEPRDESGALLANRVSPGKRPRSSMAPTLVMQPGANGAPDTLSAALGSPGGSVIIQFVVKTLVGMLDWKLNPQQAVSMIDFGTANTPTSNVGGEHPLVNTANGGADDPLVKGLRERGEQVSVDDQSSGLSALQRSGNGWLGGADPRREGAVMGDDASLK